MENNEKIPAVPEDVNMPQEENKAELEANQPEENVAAGDVPPVPEEKAQEKENKLYKDTEAGIHSLTTPLVLAILALVLITFASLGGFWLIAAIIGLILGIVALILALRQTSAEKKAVSALVLAILSVVLGGYTLLSGCLNMVQQAIYYSRMADLYQNSVTDPFGDFFDDGDDWYYQFGYDGDDWYFDDEHTDDFHWN